MEEKLPASLNMDTNGRDDEVDSSGEKSTNIMNNNITQHDVILQVDNHLLRLLAAAPASQHKMVTRLMHGQRFIHIYKTKLGFWRKKKCHLTLTRDLKYIVYSPIKGESAAAGRKKIPTEQLTNVTCSGMYGVQNPPTEFRDMKTFSILLTDGESRNVRSLPKTWVMHLTPDINCVQIGEVVEFTEQSGAGEVSKDGVVIEYNQDNPSVVHVAVKETKEVISVVGETLNRTDGEVSNQAHETAAKTVWDWYNGLVKIKALVAQNETLQRGDFEIESKREDEERTFATGKTRKAWHHKVLTCGVVFRRAFIGAKWKECKTIHKCYVRCSHDLSEILYAPVSCFTGDGVRLYNAANDFPDTELKSAGCNSMSTQPENKDWMTPVSTPQYADLPAIPGSPSTTPSAHNMTPGDADQVPDNDAHQTASEKCTSETLALFQAGKEMYHENRIRQMVNDANVAKSKARKSKRGEEEPKSSQKGGFFLKGASRKIRVLRVKDLAEILTDSRCPTFRGCKFSVGLRFKGAKETVISFDCHTRRELDRWHRQFTYLKEIKGGVTKPVNVRAGFRMQGDLKWQGSFEEHFEFYCTKHHKMNLEVGEVCQHYRCNLCHLKANRDTMFFHVCPRCNFSMCTKCAKRNSKIGEGGFSEVHLAINKNMVDKPPCVIKIFKNMMGHSALKKMVMETDVLFRLQAHPNIVKYQGYGGPNENGQLWMVMEYCDGGSVLDLRNGMKTLMAESHIAYIVHCVLRALAFLHSKNVAHKDIKAANILLTTHGFVKLSDFGISEQVKQNSEVQEFAGSPLWMPPELYRREPVDEKGDIWSLGITAIELAEGKSPYAGLPLQTIALRVVRGDPPTLRPKSSLNKKVRKDDSLEWSDEFKRFLARCFTKDPKDRPSAVDLLSDPFMDEEQFKLTTFCNRLMNVMQDAGIFEMSNASKSVGDRSMQVHKNVPALICRKSLLYLIRRKNYKEVIQEDDAKSDKKFQDELPTIRNRLFNFGKDTARRKKDVQKDQKGDINKWSFMQTLQAGVLNRVIEKPGPSKRPSTVHKGSETGSSSAGVVIPSLNLGQDDLTKTRPAVLKTLNKEGKDMSVLQENPSSAGEMTMPRVLVPGLDLGGDDLTQTKKGQLPPIVNGNTVPDGKTLNGLPGMAPLDLAGDDMMATRPGRVSELPVVQERVPRKRPVKGSPGFITNTEETFRFVANGENRFFVNKNFSIGTQGKLDTRETSTPRTSERIRTYEYKRPDLIHIRHLGRGASGFVVKSFHIPSKRFVALKHMSLDDAKQRHQLDKELTAFVKVQNAQVVQLEGAYLEGDRIVIVLEYMDLGSLQDVIRRRNKIPEKYIAQMAKQALEGVLHIHDKKFLHRDIKPDNFLVSSNGEVKVADFGLMREMRDKTSVFTKTGTLCYFSPERIQSGNKYSYPADVWAIGISLIYCATGKLPVPKDFWSLVDAIDKKPSPRLDRKTFSPNFCDFVEKCLKKDPKERWTAAQLLQHDFIKNAPDKRELSRYLCSGEEKTTTHRAEHEITLLAREIYHNRGRQAGDIFVGNKHIGQLASQLRVKGSFLAPIAMAAWEEAQKSAKIKYEFWKPDKGSI
mmetsp:Transcript_23222/g.46629  ORF Transcript_23222/g.46629 Transcript_23222/m.46629 type:complete len:1587 (+) Transcript_23222:126-4886(+)